MLPLLFSACSSPVLDQPAAEVARRPEPHPTTAVALARVDGGRYTLPPSSRPAGAAAPARFPLAGTFERDEARNKVDVWRIPLPVHDNLLPTRTEGTHVFGSDPPPGMVVTGPDGDLPFERNGRTRGSWGFDREHLFVGLASGSAAPVAAAYSVTFPPATEAENGLNFAASGRDARAFVQRDTTFGRDSHRGLLLPAPAEARFDLTVPAAGRLAFEAKLLAPAIRADRASDGAVVRVLVHDARGEHEVGHLDVDAGSAPVSGRFDLAGWSGSRVELVLRTEPGGDALYDYVLLEAPTVYAPSASPRRIVLLFVDTLRPDHLGFYGYERRTSPKLDRWARFAAVFDQARSVAPWTLPSTRAVLTGHQPERYFEVARLQETLSVAGWRTEAHVTNAFLSQPFDTHLGWDHFRYDHLLDAADVTEVALETLSSHEDRDLLLMVHFMEPHMPYSEPRRFQGLFAGGKPATLEEVSRAALTKIHPGSEGFEEIRSYVEGRYDQNVRAVDDALGALIAAAGREATVVLFSDHGEELWDHGGFEHGHTFYDELLHVPLAIKSPALPPGRHAAPVSLLDVTPTVLEIAGLPADPAADGRSLVSLAWGDTGEADTFGARPQAFGRPLYGEDGWGVVTGGRKWWERDGRQVLFDLSADAAEERPLQDGLEAYPATLGAALGREVHTVWRVRPVAPRWPFDVDLTVSHPDGIAAVWLAYEPRGPVAVPPKLVDDRVHLRIPATTEPAEAFYVLPKGDPARVTGLAVSFVGRGINLAVAATEDPPAGSGDTAPVLLRLDNGRFAVTVDTAHVPAPAGDEVVGFHPDVAQELKELGYVE